MRLDIEWLAKVRVVSRRARMSSGRGALGDWADKTKNPRFLAGFPVAPTGVDPVTFCSSDRRSPN